MDKNSYVCVTTEGGCAIDNSVGNLVWVRRRNGHWWPGRVLAAHEVPGSHLLASKSGTPVQLLGKDDASVDWYNFGKSRRIKAFRCGEFDDFIDRAKSNDCLRSKNREKYARRDDAILHALELERRQGKGIESLGRSLSAAAVLGPPVSARRVTLKNDLKGNSHVASLESRRSTFVQASHVSNSSDGPTKLRPSTTFDMDNGVPPVIPRMRGLQDFGLQVANSKASKTRYRIVSEACSAEDDIGTVNEENVSCYNLQGASRTEDGNNNMESCITRLAVGGRSVPSVSKNLLPIIQKRKKHPTGFSADESSCKKRDQRLPLNQVLKKSSNKVAVLDCETSTFPSSMTDCHSRVYCSSGTEASGSQCSQDTFLLAIDESRPSSEQRDYDLQPTDYRNSYELEQDWSVPPTASDTARTSFWSNFWDNGRWPSLVGAHMDFGLLLGSPYTDSIYKGTKPASCWPAVAYTGSATSANTSNVHKSDSFQQFQESSKSSDAVNTETCLSKTTDCDQKNVQEQAALHSMAKWQAKRRRNVRKSPHCLGVGLVEGGSFLRENGIYEFQDLNAGQLLKASGSTDMRPLTGRRSNLLVSNYDAPSTSTKTWGKKVTSQRVCLRSKSSKSRFSSDTRMQGFVWVNVRTEFKEGHSRDCVELVSLFSEVMNKVVLGYPVAIQVLGSRSGVSSLWHKSKPNSLRQMTSSRVPRCLRHVLLNQSPERESVCKVRSKYRGRKPARKSGSTLQKTRMLSSLASTEFAVGKELDEMHASHGATASEVSKTPLVTCIPVHQVFQRIREVLYKQPARLLKETSEEIASKGEP